MKKPLKILVVSPEVAPFSKTNLIAEFSGSYSKKLKNIGHDVRIITPQYRVVNERKYTLRDVIRLKDIDVSVGSDVVQINVKSSFLPDSKVQVYFIDYKPYFFREGLYRDPGKNEPYSDNDKRFILFSKSVMETLKKLQWQPDVIHCNEWQTGLIPFFLHYIYKKDAFFQSVSTLYTIRDFSDQGSFNAQCVSLFGLEKQTPDVKNSLIANGEFSFLKAGIKTADCVNSTNSTYLKKLESDTYYKKLFKLRQDKLNHIRDQIDYSVWNSEQDPYIPATFSLEALEGKEKNKEALLERYKLKFDSEIPVCAIISSFIDIDGIKLLKESFEDFSNMNMYLIIITSKEDLYYNYFKKMKQKYKDRIGLQEYYDVKSEHMTLAGSDIMLVPSLYDSTGLSASYSFMYGVVPIVYRAGVTTEYILHYDDKNKNGNALIVDDFNHESLVSCVKKAVDLYNDKTIWNNIINNVMNRDFLKQETIKKYEKLYNKCIKK
ncbi:MAG: glycogen/starch synthase [bacterium]